MAVEGAFPFRQIKFMTSHAEPTHISQVYKVSVDSKLYAAKLFEPYRAIDIDRLRLKSYHLSDAELQVRFHPWRREIRVYRHINECIRGFKRTFFPIYHGTTKLRGSSCPHQWRCTHQNMEDVPIIILELLDERVDKEQGDLQISDLTRQTAQELHAQGLNAEYVHIYIHCMEKIEVLHDIRVIHGDIKPDIFMNNASVVCDFSSSWSWDENDEPCLDPFKLREGPRSFESRREGERKGFQNLVIREYESNGTELRGRVPSWQDCSRCQQILNEIVSMENKNQ